MSQSETLRTIIAHRYILRELLGRGGMGAVYRAIDRLGQGEAKSYVALKRVLAPTENLQFMSVSGANNDITSLRFALAAEFQTLASLRHPHIINVLDYGFDDVHQPYFTMQFLADAQTFVDAGRGQPIDVQVDLLIQTLQALAYLHRRGVLHRDLKPGNVLVEEVDGQKIVKVLDFGLSIVREEATETVGTLAYMSPEIVQGGKASFASDLYAVGVMAYEIMAGRHPFDEGSGPSMLLMQVISKAPDMTLLDAPPDLVEVIESLLAKNPGERLGSADAVIEALCEATNRPVPVETQAIRESFLQSAAFVGRDEEMAKLRSALQEAVNGSGSSWLIGGESGVGKTRLLNELRIGALVEGVIVVRGQG
ncbi:MAG: serine/threonine-protein kinase PknK, partial [Chloroflexi bacterium]|nr:serine/threonine-protein kinase PknK [Chloroflexota bacterium]